MKKLAERRKALADLQVKGKAMCDLADKEGRDFTDEEQAAFAAIEASIETIKAEIAAAERMDERRRTMAPLNPAGHNAVHDTNPELTGGFADIGEFATAVVNAVTAAQRGGAVDSRLVATPSGTHQGGGSAGEGYSLPPQFRDDVWDLVNGFDEFGPMIDEEPTNAREVKLTADETTPWGTSGVQAYWRGENKAMTNTQLDDLGRSVPLHELYALVTASEELLEDIPRLNNRLTNKAAEAIAWKKNLSIVDGSGVGQPLGWMKSAALIEVAKESGQAADTITSANVIKMYSRLKMIPGDRPFWLVNQTALEQLMTMTIGDKPIWIAPTGLDAAPGGFLLGQPVRFSEFAETLGDKGDIQLVSPKGYYGVRRASGVKFASSIHLYFDFNIQAFRWTFRYGGQPHLSAPVMPAKGNATQSHFVTLAARA